MYYILNVFKVLKSLVYGIIEVRKCYEIMFPSDQHWLPYILEGKKIKAFFEFDEEWI